MRKLNKHSKTKVQPINEVVNLQDLLNSYDPASLQGLLSAFENGEAWKVFLAYAYLVQRQYEVEALDLMGKEGANKSAAFASGYAKGVEDVANKFIQGLRNTIARKSDLVEFVRPEEEAEIASSA